MKKRVFILSVCLGLIAGTALPHGNDSIEHVVYLVGNSAFGQINDAQRLNFRNYLQAEKNPFSIIHLGDILPFRHEEALDARVKILPDLKMAGENGQVLYIPGDRDWDLAGMNGLKVLRKTEEKVEQSFGGADIFLPSDGCPGPEIIDLSPHLRVIAIDTHWWMHPYDKPEAPDSDCKQISREDMIESLEEAIEDSEGKNILIVGHHPVISAGPYGGHFTIKEHLFPFGNSKHELGIPLPLFGSFYLAYLQNVGTVGYMANKDYQEFINQMRGIMDRFPGIIYASAHEFNLQMLELEKGYQLISGSIRKNETSGREHGLLFSGAGNGFAKLAFYNNGKIVVRFYGIGPNEPEELFSRDLFSADSDDAADEPLSGIQNPAPASTETKNQPGKMPTIHADSVTVKPGSYEAGKFKRIFLGSLYRNSWSTPVRIPYLNLDSTKGGLTPFALGGGRQTTTLKFQSPEGKEYAFRSVDKNLMNALPPEYRNSFVSKMVKEVSATGHPYGALVASSLLDETDILHARPELYVLPDHPNLGIYRKRYAGLFGMLEERPKDPTDSATGFMGADDITGSMSLFRKLYKDNDNSVDAESFARARAFDILIGDWSRHEDNWKWAGYNNGKGTVYHPIPRDRDHAFSRWNGILPYLADREWAMPMVENFDDQFHDIKSLTWQARHLDRFLLSELDRSDWNRISVHIQQKMTDTVINRAVAALPPEETSKSGMELYDKLISRRDHLAEAVDSYYLLLARQVDVVGSNKHEYFEIERYQSGNVKVRVYKRNKEGKIHFDQLLYSREFLRKETREIRLYGLDGADMFTVSGSSRNSIPVRIIGGPDLDEINDFSRVQAPGNHTFIYDNKATLLHPGPDTKSHLSNDPGVNLYDRKSFKYNTYLPMPMLFYSSDDGIAASVGIKWTTQGFRKEEFKSSYNLFIRTGTYGNVQLGATMKWKEIVDSWDLGLNVNYGLYYPYYNYFGPGNSSVIDPALYADQHYQINVLGLKTYLYTENEFFEKATFRLGLRYEDLNSDEKATALLTGTNTNIPGGDRISLGGVSSSLSFDFRDRPVFATRGLQFTVDHTNYFTLSGSSGNFGTLNSFLKYYLTVDFGLPLTLVTKLGGSRTFGQQVPFYKYSYLGKYNNLRGYRRNRFTGDASAYLNTELRIHLGKFRNGFMPFEYGLTGFYDRGRVWYEGTSEGGWHSGYGAGFYISPFKRDYLFTVQFESSEEERLLIRLGMGFFLDE